jgi:hypothetical protein
MPVLAASRVGMVPRITASQMRNRIKGIAVPYTIAVLKHQIFSFW